MSLGIADEQFRSKVLPFIFNLSSCDRDPDRGSLMDLRSIEYIPPPGRLMDDLREVRSNGTEGIGGCSKALELWVMNIPARTSFEDFLREESFTPDREKSLSVEITGMERPEAHYSSKYFSSK